MDERERFARLPAAARRALALAASRATSACACGGIAPNPRLQRLLALAVAEADRLLLGLVREGAGIAAGMLQRPGSGLERGQVRVRRVLDTDGPAPLGAA